jgi:hypothetical protein
VQHAPSVAYPVGRFVWERRLVWGNCLLGVLVCVGWIVERLWQSGDAVSIQGSRWGLALVVLAWLIWWRWLMRAELATPAGELVWASEPTQEAWSWVCAGDVRVVDPRIALDLGNCLWLRVDCAGGHAAWVWVLQRADPSQWLALRRALQSSSNRRLTPRV